MKQRIFSGIQPSGNLHIGNYLGAIKNWVKLQDQYDSIFCVVDMHAITVSQDPEELKKKTIEVAKIYLASGIDPKKCSIFIQSHVPEHAELAWILNTITQNGDLTKMTQFKDKSGVDLDDFIEKMFSSKPFMHTLYQINRKRNEIEIKPSEFENLLKFSLTTFKERFNSVPVGIFDYPILMASDILLYDTELVPVGKDQVQHIELTRDLAKRFNKKFGDTFIIPKPYTKKEGENIMGLDNPTRKMSKSAQSEYNYISLTDDEETIRKKIKKAVTDSGNEILYVDNKPALKNLINIYSLFCDLTVTDIEIKFKSNSYVEFKDDLAEEIIKFLKPFQEKIREYSDEKVLEILHEGAQKVRPIAKVKLDEVKKKIGFIA
jgi:tryptophanyl-tRNA synthetase